MMLSVVFRPLQDCPHVYRTSIMTEVLSTQHSRVAPAASNHEELLLKLDGLLEHYLHLLDEYQTAREQLSRQLSSVCQTRLRLLEV